MNTTAAAFTLTFLASIVTTPAAPPTVSFRAAPPGLRSPESAPAPRAAARKITITSQRALAADEDPAPGVHRAIPFSGVVIIPEAMDTGFAVVPPETQAVARVIEPPSVLVPLRR